MKRDTLTTLALILGTVVLTYACTEVDDIDDGGDTGAAVTDTGTEDTGSMDSGLTEDQLCDAAREHAGADCAASLEECACNIDDHWNMDDYESEHMQWCYASEYWSCYDSYCVEDCFNSDPDSCCYDVMDFILEERPETQPEW